MECPRCGDDLERYVLRGREAVICEACGYIGVPVEHRGETREAESWTDAISRVDGDEGLVVGTVETASDTTPSFVTEPPPRDRPTPPEVRLEGAVDPPERGEAPGGLRWSSDGSSDEESSDEESSDDG